MIKKLILSVFLLTNISFSQVVYTDPPFSTRLDTFSIYFDATLGNGALAGYQGDDVYAHTGVTIEGEGTWLYVNAKWTDNLPHRKLTRIENDLWRLDIGNPYEYYDVPDNKVITQLSFVFKNSNQSVTGRDVNGADIFLDLEEPGAIAVAFVNPFVTLAYGKAERSPYFMDLDSTLQIKTIAIAKESLLSSHKLFLNDKLLLENALDSLEYIFEPQNGGMHLFKVLVEDEGGRKDSSFNAIMVLPDIVDEERPEGIEDGITYISDTEVTLSFLAPYKEHAFLIGDFNDWQVSEQYMMKSDAVTEDEVHWWIELSGITPGQEYAFQYLVDGKIRIADPLTHKILHKNDAGIPASTYPDLKPYPDGKTDNAVAVFQTAQPPYEWQVEDFQAPPQEELIIYELLVRDFIAAHDYKTLKDTLDYLENLGINAIELMPVNEFENNESWGYNTSFLMALDKYYGPAEDLKAFIDECHARGIAVIMDIVLNHQFGQSPLVQLYLDYYGTDEIIMKLPNPWFNRMTPDLYNKYGADFNHGSPHTRYLVDRTTQFWLTEFRFDGFRFDYTKGFTNKVGEGSEYDPARIANLKRMADYIWSVNPNAYVICENWTVNSEEKELAEYGMMLWGHPNSDKDQGYYEAAMGYNDGGKSDFSWGYYGTRGWDVPHLVTKIESHDEERLMYKNINYGNSSGDYDITELSTALQRMKAVASFYFTIPGPKLFWQFMEVGYDFSIDYNGRVGNKPIRWDYFQDIERRNVYNTFKELLRLRRDNEAFRKSSTVNMSLDKPLKKISISYNDLNIIIIGNFGVISGEINPNFFYASTWYDFFSGDSIEVIATNALITLEAGEFHIYTDKKLQSPAQDPTIASVSQKTNQSPNSYYLGQNYPNPYNPLTKIQYHLKNPGHVQLNVYNMLGQKVAELVNSYQQYGKYTIDFNGANLASGIYFYSIIAADFKQTKKMLLIK